MRHTKTDLQKQPPCVLRKKKVFLKIPQISQENSCVGVSFLKHLQAFRPETLSKRDSNTDVFL